MKTISAKPGYLTVSFSDDQSYVYFDWENFEISLEDCIDAFRLAEKAMVERGVFLIVSDIGKVKQNLKPEVAKWWGEVCIPSLAKTGVKLIVNLVPRSPGAEGSASSKPETMNGIVMHKAHSLGEAQALVQDFLKSTMRRAGLTG